MKKRYDTPACRTIVMETGVFLSALSANTYGNDEGNIRYLSTEVNAEDAD